MAQPDKRHNLPPRDKEFMLQTVAYEEAKGRQAFRPNQPVRPDGGGEAEADAGAAARGAGTGTPSTGR